jgi:hypothetical protein
MMQRSELSPELSDEYDYLIGLLGQFQSFMQCCGLDRQPDWNSKQARTILKSFRGALEHEIPIHFAAEESILFPVMEKEGYGNIVAELRRDHRLILELMRQIKPLVAKVDYSFLPLAQEEWEKLFILARALLRDLFEHADTEENAMAPELPREATQSSVEQAYDCYKKVAAAYKQIHGMSS